MSLLLQVEQLAGCQNFKKKILCPLLKQNILHTEKFNEYLTHSEMRIKRFELKRIDGKTSQPPDDSS